MKDQIIPFLFFLSLLVTVLAQNRSGNAIEILGSSHEATLDIPIRFTAIYDKYKEGEQISYLWEDDLWTYQSFVDNGSSNWSMTYDSKTYSGYTGTRRVTVTAIASNITGLVTASFDFNLKDTLAGNIFTYQKNVTIPTHSFISTSNQTNITARIHDPENWMKLRTKRAHFFWYISSAPGISPNVKIHAECSTPSLLVNLTQPGTYMTTVIVSMSLYNISTDESSKLMRKGNIVKTTSSTNIPEIKTSPGETSLNTEVDYSTLYSTHSTHHTHPPPNVYNWTCDGWWPTSNNISSYFFKVGFFSNMTTARDPIDSLTIAGDTWINNGDILLLNISCGGSGPWYSCNKTVDVNYNITGNETCMSENLIAETNYDICRFNLSHYFKFDGSYTYLLIIYNDVSVIRRNITVNIYKGAPQPYLYSIILPVFCSLVVTIIILLGWVHLKRNKERYFLEVADFDFLCPDEVECHGIMDQLKETLKEALSKNKEDEEEEDNESRRRKRSNIVVEKLSVLDFSTDSEFIHEH